jgi:hypothetical protein
MIAMHFGQGGVAVIVRTGRCGKSYSESAGDGPQAFSHRDRGSSGRGARMLHELSADWDSVLVGCGIAANGSLWSVRFGACMATMIARIKASHSGSRSKALPRICFISLAV